MANNVTNIIELRGKPERVQELLNVLTEEGTDYIHRDFLEVQSL